MLTARFALVAAVLTMTAAPRAVEQSADSPCQAVAARTNIELFQYGTRWLAWSELERLIYLFGFVDGGSVYFDFMFRQPEQVRNEVFTRTVVKYDPEVLSPVITSLYRDPANVYIRTDSMVFIARDKLAGEDIEPRLRTARQRDCGGSSSIKR